jgi:hypothetical protein
MDSRLPSPRILTKFFISSRSGRIRRSMPLHHRRVVILPVRSVRLAIADVPGQTLGLAKPLEGEHVMSDIPTTGGGGAPVSASGTAGRRNGIGTAALVIGVVSLVLAVLIIFAPLAALLGLIGTGLGIAGILRVNRGMADNRGQAAAGLITALLGLALGVAISISVGTFLTSHVTDFNRLGSCLDNASGSAAREACAREFADRLGK